MAMFRGSMMLHDWDVVMVKGAAQMCRFVGIQATVLPVVASK